MYEENKNYVWSWIYFLLQNILLFTQKFSWKFYNENQVKNYETSAHVCRIICRCRLFHELSSKNNFIYLHKEFCHPKLILQDNISLYHINENEAVFVDCGTINIFGSKRNSFLYNTQFENAIDVIIMPLSSLKKISDEIPIPKIPMLHAANHGRCGSTLLFRLFESLPNALSISEPTSFTDLADFSMDQRLDTTEMKSLCEASLKMLFKHAISRKSEMLFMKSQCMAVFITDIICDVVPQMKQIYMYRDPIPFVRSYEKLIITNKWSTPTLGELKHLAGIGLHRILDGYPLYEDEFYENLSLFTKFSLFWILGTAAYKKLLKLGYPIQAFKYEDLLKDPNVAMKKLLLFMEVHETKMRSFDDVMNQDSQSGTLYTSRSGNKELFEKMYVKIDDNLKKEIDHLCKEYDVPLFWDGVVLPNTIR